MGDETKLALVVGANKGVGLAVCQKLCKEGYKVLGTTREQAEALQSAGLEAIEGFDIATSDPAILTQALGQRKLDLLVIAAGIQERDNIETLTRDTLHRQMEVNAYGPIFVVQALRRALRTNGKVALIGSKMGSIANVGLTGGEMYGYRMSKAAMHIAGATLAQDLKGDQIPVAIIHPGVVFTDMLRTLREARGVSPDKIRDNSITPEASADGIWSLVQGLTLDNTGEFWAADSGKHLEW